MHTGTALDRAGEAGGLIDCPAEQDCCKLNSTSVGLTHCFVQHTSDTRVEASMRAKIKQSEAVHAERFP